MALNRDALLHRPPQVFHQRYTARDTILYALGVGVGIEDPTDSSALRFVYERELVALPTLAIVLAAPSFWLDDPALGMDWKKVLNAGQELRLHAPLPIEGEVTTTLHIDALWDKGAAKGALMESHRDVRDATGTLLASISQAHILRGDGGFGGTDKPPVDEPEIPSRAADAIVDLPTRRDLALLYRLSGDYNPLHIDPAVATAAGFDKPILHGSCTFGVVGRAVLRVAAGNQPQRLKRFGARFSRPVMPGDTIRTEIWCDGGLVLFRAKALERDTVVLDRGVAEVVA
jgi:acyl dehydratase